MLELFGFFAEGSEERVNMKIGQAVQMLRIIILYCIVLYYYIASEQGCDRLCTRGTRKMRLMDRN